jgi:hypothetical protein
MNNRVAVCEKWYKAFEQRQLSALMALFGSNPVVVVGAGGSGRAVSYSGTFTGRKQVREYYKMRFEYGDGTDSDPQKPKDTRRPIRPYCGVVRPPIEIDPWVMFSGIIRDHPNVSEYDGPFLHVFRFEAQELIASLEMFLVP